MPEEVFEISVHACTDTDGFIVKLVWTVDGSHIGTSRFPVPDRGEADAMTLSIKNYLDAGCDPRPLFPKLGEKTDALS